jgi:HEAT repeat protein
VGIRAKLWCLPFGAAALALSALARAQEPPPTQDAPPPPVVASTPEPPPQTLREQCTICGGGDLAALLVRLASTDPNEREAAVKALALAPPTLVISPLARVAVTDPAPGVRAAAVRALGKSQDLRALGTILAASSDASASVRLAALEALGGLPATASRERLAAVARDPAQALSERQAALKSLRLHRTREAYAAIQELARAAVAAPTPGDPWGNAVSVAAQDPAPCDECLEMRRTQVLLDLFATSAERRRMAVVALGALPIPVTEKLQLLDHALADEDGSTRAGAVQSLVAVARSTSAALPLMARVATSAPDEALRRLVALELVGDERPEASAALKAAALDAQEEVALRAVDILTLRKDPTANAALAEAVGHSKEQVAKRALLVLAARRLDPEVEQRAATLALTHPSPAVAEQSGRLLRPGELATAELGRIALARRGELSVGATIAMLVGRPEPEAIAEVVELLRANSKAVAGQILELVAARKTDATLPALVPVLAAGLEAPALEISTRSLQLLTQAPRPNDAALAGMLATGIEQTSSVPAAKVIYRFLVRWKPKELDAVERRLLANRALPVAIRAHAATTIGRSGVPDWAEALEPYRDDPANDVRRTIVALLARAGSSASAPKPVQSAEIEPADVAPSRVAGLIGTTPPPSADMLTTAGSGTPSVGALPSPEAVPMAASPEELPDLPAPDLPWNGRWPLVMSIATMGAVAFGTVANIAEMNTGGQFAAYSLGGVIGGATPFLLTLNRDVTMGQAMYITSHAGWGAAAGLNAAQLMTLEKASDLKGVNRSVGILTGLAGAGFAAWRARGADWTGKDAFLANVTAIQAGVFTKSFGMLVDSHNPDHNAAQLNSLAVVTAWGAGLMPATLFNRELMLTSNDGYLLALSAGTGAWLLGWGGHGAGRELLPTEGQRLAVGALAGQSLGFLVGEVLSYNLEVDPQTTGKLALHAGLGAALGLGLGFAVPREGPSALQLALAVDGGTALGLLGAIALPHARDFAPGKRDMLLLSALYGGAAGALLPLSDAEYSPGARPTRMLGGALTGGSLGLLVGSVLAPAVDPEPRTLVAGTGLVLWGGTLGLGTGLLSCDFARDRTACVTRARLATAAQLGAVSGLLGAGFLASRLPTTSTVVSNGLAGSAWGAWNGYLLARLDAQATRPVVLGGAMSLMTLAGATGYLASDRLGLGPEALWLGLAGSLAGNAWGAGLGYLIPESSTRLKLGLTVAAPIGLAAVGGVAAQAIGREPEIHVAATALGFALGAWHAALVPSSWRPDPTAKDQRIAGGVVVGGLTGAALAVGLSPWLDDADLVQTTLVAVAGNAIGAGLGLYRDRQLALSMQLMGVSGMVLGAATAPWTSYSGHDVWWITSGMLIGGWNGALLSGGIESQDGKLALTGGRRASGGLLMGGAAGGLLVGAVTQAAAPRGPLDSAEILLASGVGNATGLGLGLLAGGRDLRPWVVAPGLSLAVAASVWAPRTTFDASSVLWVASAAGLGGWHGLLIYGYPHTGAFAKHQQTAYGAGLVGAGIATLGVGSLAQWVERRPADVGEIVLAAGVGNVLGRGLGGLVASSKVARERDRLESRLSLGLGLALTAGGTVLAPGTTYDQEAWLWSAALAGVGGWHGALIGGLPGGTWKRERGEGGLLSGAAIGALAGASISQWYRPAVADTGEMLLYGALGNALGLGIGLMPRDESPRATATLMQSVGLATTLGGAVFAPRWEHSRVETPATVAAIGLLGVSGYFAPQLSQTDRQDEPATRQRAGATMAGAALGFLAAAPLTQQFTLTWGDSAELLVAYAGGSTFGHGLGGMIDPEGPRLQTSLQLAGAALSSGTILALHQYTHYSATDVGLGALGSAIGLWHGQLGGRRASRVAGPDEPAPDTPTRTRYTSLMAGGLSALGALGLAQVIDYQPWDLAEIGAGDVVGNLIGVGIGLALPHDPHGRRRVVAQHVAGIGLAGAALVLSPYTTYKSADLTTLASGTLVGMSLGSWLPGAWRDSPSTRERVGAGLTGAGVGLVTGAAMAQWQELEVGEAAGAFAGLGALLLIGDGSMQLALGNASSKSRTQGASGVAVALGAGLSVAAPYLRFDAIQPSAMMAGALMGGLAGLGLPEIIPGPAARTHRKLSGLEMGMPLGALAAGLASPHLSYEPADLAELSTAMLVGSMTGYAGGCLFDGEDCLSSRRRRSPAIGAELVGFGVLGLAIGTARSSTYEPADYLYISAGAAFGGLSGGLLADNYGKRGRDGAFFGAGLGFLGSAAAANALHLSPGDTFEAALDAGLAQLFVDSVARLSAGRAGESRAATQNRILVESLAGVGVFAGASYLSAHTSYTGSDAALMLLTSGLGGWGGFRLASLDNKLSDQSARTTLAGTLLGGFAGALTSQYLELDSTTLGFAAGGALAGNLFGWSLGQLAETSHARGDLSAVAMTAGGMSLALAGGMFGDRLSMGASNAGMITLIGVTGAWHGAWLSRTWDRTPAEASPIVGGGLLGGGLGLMTGAAFASQLEYAPADIAESAMSWVAANSLGAGLGLAFGPKDDNRLTVGLMEGLGAVGTVVMAGLAPQTEFSGEDWVLGVLATSHGVWQGIGTARLLAVDDPRRLAGGVMITTAVGGVAGAVISQRFNLTLAETLAGFSGTLWGAWLGAWTGVIWGPNLTLDAAGLSAAGSDVGLVLTAMAVSRIGDMPPARVGAINLFAAGGALAGAAVGVLIPTSKNIEKGTLFGTGAGLVVGAFFSEILDLGTSSSTSPSAGLPTSETMAGPWRLPEWVPSIDLAMPVVGPQLPINPEWPVSSSGISVGLQGLWH